MFLIVLVVLVVVALAGFAMLMTLNKELKVPGHLQASSGPNPDPQEQSSSGPDPGPKEPEFILIFVGSNDNFTPRRGLTML